MRFALVGNFIYCLLEEKRGGHKKNQSNVVSFCPNLWWDGTVRDLVVWGRIAGGDGYVCK